MWDRDVPVAVILVPAMPACSGAGGGQKWCGQAGAAPNTEDCILALRSLPQAASVPLSDMCTFTHA